MPSLELWGKMLVIIGVIIALFGVVAIFWHRTPFLGKLPGDIFVQKGNFQFFCPIVTCLILSVILTLVINLILRLFGK
jgi:hypothetical protein